MRYHLVWFCNYQQGDYENISINIMQREQCVYQVWCRVHCLRIVYSSGQSSKQSLQSLEWVYITSICMLWLKPSSLRSRWQFCNSFQFCKEGKNKCISISALHSDELHSIQVAGRSIDWWLQVYQILDHWSWDRRSTIKYILLRIGL
jgi:hypothetical protein